MPESGAGEYSPDGTKLVYSPLFRDFRPEKRYSGGLANDLFIFDLKTNEGKRVIDSVRVRPRPDVDRQHHLLQLRSRRHVQPLRLRRRPPRRPRQVTTSKMWDVRWPGSDRAGRIVYELNGELQRPRRQDGKERRAQRSTCPTTACGSAPSRVSAAGQIEDCGALAQGRTRSLQRARRHLHARPSRRASTRNLTGTSSDAHDKWARWSPDGVEDRVHLRPVAARRSCTSSRRTARASPSS